MSLRRYEKEFKEEAVILANDFGVTVAADKLGIPVGTLRTWVDNNKKLGTSHVGSGNKKIEVSDPDKARLIKENKELQRANEILKEALTFFVVSQKK